ncbi:hypothetical protein O9929_14720 [Vibrio lentus]|nr:hypothetical protein [Vibrio lentus]
MFPAVGAVREVGTTVIIEDVAFPVENLANGIRELQELFDKYDYSEAIIFGHAPSKATCTLCLLKVLTAKQKSTATVVSWTMLPNWLR